MHFSSDKQWNHIKIRKKEFGANLKRFTERLQMAEKHMKRYPTSLVMRKENLHHSKIP